MRVAARRLFALSSRRSDLGIRISRYLKIIGASAILTFVLTSCNTTVVVNLPDNHIQYVPSDSAKMNFLPDATDYAIGHLQATSSPDTANVFIADSILNISLYPLACLYDKRHQIPLLDTPIVQRHIHKEAIYCEGLELELDTSFVWVQNIKNGVSPTGDTVVDSIVQLCHLQFHYIFVLNNGNAFVTATNPPLNTYAIAQVFRSITGVTSATQAVTIHPFSKLAIIFSPTETTIRLYYGYGDCLLGCFGYDRWTFAVSKNFEVTYQGYLHQ